MKNYLLHFDALDGAFTLERKAPTLRAAYALALELCKGRVGYCYVKGVEEAPAAQHLTDEVNRLLGPVFG